MKNKILISIITLILLFGILTVLPIHGESEIYSDVLRLHVIASSDSEADQALKLLVRDAVLLEAQTLLDGVYDRKKAESIISENLELFKATAEKVIRENGYDYPVSVELGKEEYPTKSYESCCFPAGEYTSLRILIGEAAGQNWWCVLFPPLCLSAATDADAFASVGITDGQYQIITESENPKYKIRFKILESFSEAIN